MNEERGAGLAPALIRIRVGVLLVGIVGVVAGCTPGPTPPPNPQANLPRGQIVELAGGPAFGVAVGSAPIPADTMPFSVYASAIREHDGLLYVRDHNQVTRIDPVAGTAQRLVGHGYFSDLSEAGAPLDSLGSAGAQDAFLDWSRSFDVGPDGDLYLDAVGAGASAPPTAGRRIFRIDAVTKQVTPVAGDGQAGPGGVGVPAISTSLDGATSLQVDDAGAVWFFDVQEALFDPGTVSDRGRRVDPVSGVIEQVLLPPRFFGFDHLGRPVGAVEEQDAGGNLLGFRLVARQPDDTLVSSSGLVEAPLGDQYSPPVLLVDGDRVIRFPAQWEPVPAIHTIDLPTGAVSAAPLEGSMLDVLRGAPLGDSNYSLLERSMTFTTDGDLAFVATQYPESGGDALKVFRWTRETPPPTPEPPPGIPWSFGDDNHGLLGGGNLGEVTEPRAVPALGEVAQVAAGSQLSLALLSNGDVVSWGYAVGGGLGDGTGRPTPTHVRVRGLSGVDWIGASGARALAIVDGATYTWGQNALCEAGALSLPSTSTPTVVSSLAGFAAFSSDGCRLFGLRLDGTVWGVGTSLMGPNGDPPAPTPAPLPGITDVVELGPHGTRMARRSDGTVITWGHAGSGVLGDGSNDQSTHPVTTVLVAPGAPLGGPANPVVSISAAGDRRFAVTADGVLWSWGTGAHGDGVVSSQRLFATAVAAVADVDEVRSGQSNVYVRTSDGRLLGWGSVIGDGTRTPRLAPVEVLSGVSALAASGGGGDCDEHALALMGDQTVRGWGCNYDGAAGAGAPSFRRSAGALLLGDQLAQLDGDGYLAVARTDSGRLLAAGSNSGDVIGTGTDAPVGSFVPVAGFEGEVVVDADVYSDIVAVLADGTTLRRSRGGAGPEVVAGLPPLTRVSAGSGSVVGLDHTARVWAWGANHDGQLGRGGFSTGEQPPAVVRFADGRPLDHVVSIDAGPRFGVAVRDDGSVWTWGFDGGTYGVLGRPAAAHPSGGGPASPVAGQVPGLSGVVEVAAGSHHVLARTEGGELWAWGDNGGGALGIESPSTSQVPRRVTRLAADGSRSPLSGVTSVAAGGGHSLAVTADGTAYAWGANHRGQLGLKSGANYAFGATAIPSLVGARSVHAVAGASYVVADPALHPSALSGESILAMAGDANTSETTDLEGDGAQVGDPIEVRVVRGASGTVSISETIGPVSSGSGLSMLPVRATTSLPAATATHPHRVELRVDRAVEATPLPEASSLSVLVDGMPFTAPCPNPNTAPFGGACLAAKVSYPDGDLGIVVNTTLAGTVEWTFGR